MPGSGPNDFYVQFDSNASQWAAGLAKQLEPAETVINRIQTALNAISAHAGGKTPEIVNRMAKDLEKSGNIPPASSGRYDHKVAEASDAVASELQQSAALMAEMITGLRTTVTSLGRIDDSISTLQRRIAATARGGQGVDVFGAHGTAGGYKGQNLPGVFGRGTPEYDVAQVVKKATGGVAEQAVRAGQSIRSAPVKLSPTTESALARISTQSLDTAAADRIVHAIEAQTAALRESLAQGARTRPPGGTPPPGAPTTPAATAARSTTPPPALTEERKQAIQGESAGPRFDLMVEESLLKLLRAQGAETAAIEEVTRRRDELAATVAKLDRAENNLTQAEQKAARKAEAKELRDTLPARTRTQEEARRQSQFLINQAGESDFAERTKRGGDITKSQLYKTAAAFSGAGIPVDYTSKTTNAQLTELLQTAHGLFRQQYSDTLPESLQPTGRYLPEDKIASEVQAFLGDVNSMVAVARQKLEAIGALDVNRTGGGGLPVRGLPEYGSGTFGPGVEGDSATTRGAVIAARKFLSNLSSQADPLAFQALQRGIGKGDFDPYSSELSKGIEGSGEEATAYRLLLNSLRELTSAADNTAKEFYAAGNAVEENRAFQDRARSRIERNQEELAGGVVDPARVEQLRSEIDNDERKIAESWNSITRNSEKLASYTNEQQALFSSPGFREGFSRRTGYTPGGKEFEDLGYGEGLGYNTRGGSRGAYNQRVLAASVYSPSERQDIKNALSDAIVGLRTGIGTREQIKNVPGLTSRNGILQPTDFAAHSIEDIQRLRYASQHVGARQADLLQASPEEFDAALGKLENAAVRAANIIQEMFHVAPPIETFLGNEHKLQDPGNIEGEYRRQLVREELQRRQQQSFSPTEQSRQAQAQSGVAAAQSGLKAVLGERESAEQRAATAAEQFAAAQQANAERIGKAGQEEAAAIEAQIAATEAQIRKTALQRKGLSGPGSIGGLAANARLGQGELDTNLRRVLLGGAQGPLPNVQASVAQLLREQGASGIGAVPRFGPGAVPQGPLNQDDTGIRQIQDLEGKLGPLFRQLSELTGISPEIIQEFHNAQQALENNTRAERSYTEQLERSKRELQGITERMAQVQAINAARASGLKKPDGSNITRKDILESVPGLSKMKQITDILGPARKPARDKQLEAADAKIAQALDQTANAEERKLAVEKEAAQVTRQLTSAEESELAAKRAERAALQAVTKDARTTTGAASNKQAVTALEEQAAAAERSAAAKRGAATRAANAGDEAKAAAAKTSAEAATADAAALRDQANAAREAKDQIAALGKRIRELEGAAGGGAGGRKPPTAQGGVGGGDDDNILRQILSVLNQIHGTLQGGLTVRGLSSPGVAGTASTPAARARALQPSDQELSTLRDPASSQQDLLAIAAAQRAREDAIGGVKPADREYAQEQALLAQETRKATAAELEQARAAQVVEKSLGQLSGATLREIEVLRQMNAAGAEASAIAAQEARVFNQVAADMGRIHASAADRAYVGQQALKAGGSDLSGAQLAAVARNARASHAFTDVGASYGRSMGTGVQSGFQQVFGGGGGFFDRILHTTGTFLVRNFAAGFVFGITNELQRAVDDAIKTQQTFVRLSSTLSATGKDVGNLRSDLQGLSSQYGVALNDMYNTAAKLAGVFDNPEDLLNGTKTVAQLTMISEGAINADEAVGSITSIWAAFQDELSRQGGAEHIADVATSLQNLTGVNIEDTVEGVARLTGLAKQMGISFDETATFVAQISRETNTSGATAGEQLSRILQQAQGAGGQTALKQVLGADIFDRNTQNGAVNYGNILKELIGTWHNLTQAQQENLTHSLAGTRQAATFAALVDNGAKTLRNLTDAQNSQGSASERMAQLMKTLSGELARLRSNFQNVVNELVQAGLLDFLGAALEGVNLLIGGFAKLLALWNELGANNQAIGAVEHLAATLLGASVALKALVSAYRGIRGAVAAQGVAGLLSGGIYGGGGVAAPVATLATAGHAASPATAGLATAAETRLTTALQERTAAELANAKLVQSGTASQAELTASARQAIAANEEYVAAAQANAVAQGVAAETSATAAGVATANADLTAAIELQVAAKSAEVRSEEQVALANQEVAAAQQRLLAAVVAHTEAEAVATEASAASGAGGLLGKVGGLRGLLGGAGRLALRAGPYAIAAGAALYAYKGQYDRVNEGTELSGGKLPGIDATGAEARAAAHSYREAFDKAMDAESKGFFGTGIGPSLTKAADSFIRPGAYDDLHLNQRNLEAERVALQEAADALDRIDKQHLQALGGETVKEPTFTSFDSETLNAKLQDLTDRGQSAAQQLHELNAVLFDTSKSAKAARGSFQVGEKTTDSLPDWLAAHMPELVQAGDKAGLDASVVGPGLRQALGVSSLSTGRFQPTQTTYRPAQPGEKSIYVAGQGNVVPVIVPVGEATTKTTEVRNPKSLFTAKNTLDAIKQTEAYYEAKAAPSADQSLSYHARVRDLKDRGFDEEAKALRTMHTALVKIFKRDRHSFETLVGASELNHKDSINLANDLEALAQQKIDSLPETDLKGRTSAARQLYRGLQQDIAKTKGRAPTELIIKAQAAANALTEAKIAELDKARIAAQAADHSKAGLRAAALKETRAAVRIAVKNGSVDALAEIISNAGKMGKALAIAALRKLQDEIDAYKAALADMEAFAAGHGVLLGELTPPDKPDHGQRFLNQALQATSGPAEDSADSPWGSGVGVPGIDDAKKEADAEKADAAQIRADQLALKQARLGVAAAYADARGDAVASARIQVRVAALSISAAKADLAAAKTLDERLQAQTAIYSAQAQLIAAHAAVAQAEAELLSSRFDVAIALAEAAGHTIRAAIERAHQANAALRLALRRSGGENTAEVNAARANAIAAEAAVRDAKLQDELDTIDFNLQMGRITQSSAIHALQHILRTEELTKAQRQQLLLQIKGMKAELADSQWNFGDIKLPTPYQMRRYIEQRKTQFRNELDAAASGRRHELEAGIHSQGVGDYATSSNAKSSAYNDHRTTTITIDGADIHKIKQILKEVIGGSVNIRTTAPRRGNR